MPETPVRYYTKIKTTEKICGLDFFHFSFDAFYETSSSMGSSSPSSWLESKASIL